MDRAASIGRQACSNGPAYVSIESSYITSNVKTLRKGALKRQQLSAEAKDRPRLGYPYCGVLGTHVRADVCSIIASMKDCFGIAGFTTKRVATKYNPNCYCAT